MRRDRWSAFGHKTRGCGSPTVDRHLCTGQFGLIRFSAAQTRSLTFAPQKDCDPERMAVCAVVGDTERMARFVPWSAIRSARAVCAVVRGQTTERVCEPNANLEFQDITTRA